MPFIITDSCIACGSCKEECPNEAVVADGLKYAILPDKCSECATCMETCPAAAVVES